MNREELIYTIIKIYKNSEYKFARIIKKIIKVKEAAINYRNKYNKKKIQPVNTQIEVGNLVLKYNSIRKIDINSFRKLSYR